MQKKQFDSNMTFKSRVQFTPKEEKYLRRQFRKFTSSTSLNFVQYHYMAKQLKVEAIDIKDWFMSQENKIFDEKQRPTLKFDIDEDTNIEFPSLDSEEEEESQFEIIQEFVETE